MLRRKPTRIELKLDDLEEWNTLKKEREQEKRLQGNISETPMPEGNRVGGIGAPKKSKKEIIQERIGYDPRPAPNH
jgi:anaphase-promoting complex subunit 12